MAIYFKDKEITNIDSLIPQTGLDITGIWFGNTNIYTVWQVYEGTLPTTFNTNGDDMRQYQVYGADGGVGDYVAPEYKQVHTDTVTIDGIVWDILGYDHDTVYKSDNTLAQHSVTIQAHDVLSEMQYDAKEALFAFDNGLTAGTYHFTVGAQPWYSGDVNKTIQFTLTQALPVGGQLVINNVYNATMIGATISAFASGTTTTATEIVTMSEGSDGTDIGTVTTGLSQDGVINSIQHALHGSNNWEKSAIRQYLNSSASAGSVWEPKNKWDRPPSWGKNTAGFLSRMSADFIAALGTVSKTTALSIVIDGGGTGATLDKMFLLSRSEVYGGNEVSGGDGVPYPYYANYSSLSGVGTGNDSNRIKYSRSNGVVKAWQLRSPNAGDAISVRSVGASGAINYGYPASNAYGIAPSCCIPLDDVKSNAWLREKFLKNPSSAFGYEVDISTEKPIIYGFHINPNDPNSYTAVTYLADAVGKTPAAMGSTAFSYGDWANAFFMPRPCMLKYDGTVDYYLNPNDYSQKADGTASDYNNLSYGGNAMMEFPLIWYKFVQGAESGEGYFYCSNRKVDDSYKCFSNLDCDGNIIEHFYMPIYNGCTYDGKMRSISGLQLSPWSTTAYSSSSTYAVGKKVNYNGRMWKCTTAVEAAEAFDPTKWEQFAFNGNTTGTEEINYAKANNTTEKIEWYTNVLCDRMLINGLLVLISKSLDTQGAFGRGIETGSQAAKEAYVTGSLDDKGLFYGSSGSNTAVKVFGMENWWACVWHRTAGLIGATNNIYKYKMTYSTSDGSTANGYNTNGRGYLSVGNKPTTNNYIKKMQYGLWGCLPIETGSYSNQFFRDYWVDGTAYARFGGYANDGANAGAFYASLNGGVEYHDWNISSDLSCKPCRTGSLSKNLEAATVTPIYIGSDPLNKDEYADYQAGKVYKYGENIFSSIGATNGKYFLQDGNIASSLPWSITDYIDVSSDSIYKYAGDAYVSDAQNVYHVFYTTNKVKISTICIYKLSTFTTPVNCAYIRLSYRTSSASSVNLQALTPTDPPVPLPALPTYKGPTIVDYVGQSQAVPEKVLMKCRKEKF